MQTYRLRADVQHCQFGAQTVCLDLSTSRYFLLEGAASDHLAQFVSGTANNEVISCLLDLGLLEAGTRASARPIAVTPTRSLLDHRQPKASLRLLYRSIREQRRAQSALLRMSLGALLEPTGLPRADPESCGAVAAAFAHASRYRDATDQCLVRGLAMRAIFARYGLGVDLIIGVTLPFAAHCWIQAGPVVLSDPFDRVRNFRPLLTAQ
jgi:uncharacterized protein YjiS (DUF1127 family)